ncbi:hypothetical protein KUTeg_019654 [Tegillarca granosa]|uniref:C-Maf-inducing protein PH domain-containing protein n=1 Tax=Tegillarca granosa TaxID=220873 RepID=A0ABQ9ED72_TEGGR|nr:hypothetical protein KUTeg_019654 [Tegillarca granosa]
MACIYSYLSPVFSVVGISCQTSERENINMATLSGVCVESTSTDEPLLNGETSNNNLSNERLERIESGSSLNSLNNSPSSTPSSKSRPSFHGTRYKLLSEGDIQICKLNHTRTIVSKIMNSRYLRRWERHKLVLGKTDIYTLTPTSMMDSFIHYSSIEDVHIISRWDAGQKFCIRISVQDGSLLMQRHVYKYEKLLKSARRPEVLVKEIKNMIDVSLSTPIQDASVYQFPLDLVSDLLQQHADVITKVAHENIIVALAPLLENNHPTQEICGFFSKKYQYLVLHFGEN